MDWTIVYETNNILEITYLQDMLQEAGIHSIVMDQTDSMYKFGDIRLMTSSSDALQARQIIDTHPFNF